MYAERDKIVAAARAEIAEENFRKSVAAEKHRLLTKRSWWDLLFPFKIKIERK